MSVTDLEVQSMRDLWKEQEVSCLKHQGCSIRIMAAVAIVVVVLAAAAVVVVVSFMLISLRPFAFLPPRT
jgi:hypothetical protein